MNYENEKEKKYNEMIDKLNIMHKIEREEFNKKIQKLRDEFNQKQKNIFKKLNDNLNKEIKELNKFQIFEQENFENIIKDSIKKNGIILSSEMGNITKKYIEHLKIKKKENQKINYSNYET